MKFSRMVDTVRYMYISKSFLSSSNSSIYEKYKIGYPDETSLS